MCARRWRAAGFPAVTGMLLLLAVFGIGPPEGKSASREFAGGAGLASHFAPDRPENQGLSSTALEGLALAVQRLINEDRVVGAEVAVIRNRRLVFQRAFGMMDRDSCIPMEVNRIYNLRSMTKPLTGVAARMLIDEGRLSETDFVSRYIPSFATGPAGGITVGHLLTHRSGLPMSVVTTVEDLFSLGSLSALADRAAGVPLQFTPGTSFNYSDTGTDVLGRVVEVVSGVSVDRFVTQRILQPIGMSSAFYYTTGTEQRGQDICSAYAGITGNWIKYWSSGAPSFYPFAMGSQTLYGTTLDYARFLAFLIDNGRVDGTRVLSSAAVERILTPHSPMPMNLGFTGVSGAYGQMMMLCVPEGAQGTEARPVCFGHGGSDGTIAWAWPDLDLIICFFTQSRGHTADFLFDTAVQQYLLHPLGSPSTPTGTDAGRHYSDVQGSCASGRDGGIGATLRPLTGKYVDIYGSSGLGELSVQFAGDRLYVDIPGQGSLGLDPPDAEGRFRISASARGTWVAFERDGAGAVTTMTWHEGGKALTLPRVGTPAADALVRKILAERESWGKYLGFYETDGPGLNAEITLRDNSLAIHPPGVNLVLYLNPPDVTGLWRFRTNPAAGIRFQENGKGEVVSFTAHLPDGRVLHRPRVAGP